MSIEVYKKSRMANMQVISLEDDYQQGDLVWVETPLNPTGESRSIKYYADKVHKHTAPSLWFEDMCAHCFAL